ncbi:MAG: hypothetical protein ABII71_05665 [Candidatus Micrarchaeota archaeon]
MSLKGSIAAFALLLAILVGYSMLLAPHEKPAEPAVSENFSFDMSILEYGLLDSGSGEGSRAFVTAQIESYGTENATIEMLLLEKKPLEKVYVVVDYYSSAEKRAITDGIERRLLEYGIEAESIYLYEAEGIEDGVIIIPSDAMPDRIPSESFGSILNGNAVIFFGKPLDVAMDHSGSQSVIGSRLYGELNLTYDERNGISSSFGGPNIHRAGSAQVAEYGDGYLVLYGDLVSPGYSDEVASLILGQSWQSGREWTSVTPGLEGGIEALGLFTDRVEPGDYYLRILVDASSGMDSALGLFDIGQLRDRDDTLRLPDVSGSGSPIEYSFELRDELDYPTMFELSLRFFKDGGIVDTVFAEPITMKTISRESGSVEANLSAGDYVVRLIDQDGRIHASAYTHIQEVDIELVRIAGADHVFLIKVDGKPAESVPVTLTANGNAVFEMHTNKNGEIRKALSLAEGTHTFKAEVGGESGITYYRKGGAGASGMLYLVMLLGGAFLVAAMAVKSRGGRKWGIRTHLRPAAASRTLKIPHGTFIEIFRRTQEDRAAGLPISVSDLRIGMHKHSVFRGSPVFLTDSNIYHVLDSLVRKGRFLSYGGYFLPSEMAGGKPIEYWVIRRKLSDYFIERGEELPVVKGADFQVRGKMLHIWQELDPELLASLARKADNIIIFPDSRRKGEFMKKASCPDPSWMKVLLEIQYGRIYCQTLDEFLERGLYGKG